MIALLAALQLASCDLSVARLERVTASPGVRENAAAVPVPDRLVVLWEQSPGIDSTAAPRPPFWIWRAVIGATRPGVPAPLIRAEGNQWWPSPLGGSEPMLAVYRARPSDRTGNRDVALYRPDPSWQRVSRGTPVTQDPAASRWPVNDATPALARDAQGRLLVAYSSGPYRKGSGYRDKDIRLVVLASSGLPAGDMNLTDSMEVGHEYAPTLLPRPDSTTALVYASDSAGNRYDLYLRLLDRRLRAGPPVRLTRSAGGAIRPSLGRAGTTEWLSWYDLGSNDILLARLSNEVLSPPCSLRQLLRNSSFAQYGTPLAGLSGAALFVQQDQLGVVFVATMALDARQKRIQQDVFVAWLAP